MKESASNFFPDILAIQFLSVYRITRARLHDEQMRYMTDPQGLQSGIT
jgi:hypothetical protein